MAEFQITIEEIPHGHGRSFKLGVAKGLLDTFDEKPTDTHDASFRRGKELGEQIKKMVAGQVKP